MFETADPPRHMWSPAAGGAGYATLWEQTFEVVASADEVRAKKRPQGAGVPRRGGGGGGNGGGSGGGSERRVAGQ